MRSSVRDDRMQPAASAAPAGRVTSMPLAREGAAAPAMLDLARDNACGPVPSRARLIAASPRPCAVARNALSASEAVRPGLPSFRGFPRARRGPPDRDCAARCRPVRIIRHTRRTAIRPGGAVATPVIPRKTVAARGTPQNNKRTRGRRDTSAASPPWRRRDAHAAEGAFAFRQGAEPPRCRGRRCRPASCGPPDAGGLQAVHHPAVAGPNWRRVALMRTIHRAA